MAPASSGPVKPALMSVKPSRGRWARARGRRGRRRPPCRARARRRHAARGLLHLRGGGARGDAERDAEFVGPDEQRIDAGQRGDLLDVVERAARLDLHHEHALLVRARRHAGVAAEAARARARVEPAAPGVAGRGGRAGRFAVALHARDDHARRAVVEHPAGLLAVAPTTPARPPAPAPPAAARASPRARPRRARGRPRASRSPRPP